jgi:hypothetical protein
MRDALLVCLRQCLEVLPYRQSCPTIQSLSTYSL